MKNILCFGDSNTYGLKPDGSGRFDFNIRYPGKLQELLGQEYHIIEEGCKGRTTVFEDKNRPYKKGIDYIVPCLVSHNPLDLVIIMLGTNDCKLAFNATSKEIAFGLSKLIDFCFANLNCTAKILIISPIHLGNSVWGPEFDPEFNENSVTVSKHLATDFELIAKEKGCAFLDASLVATASHIDEEHLDEAGHAALALAVSKKVVEILG